MRTELQGETADCPETGKKSFSTHALASKFARYFWKKYDERRTTYKCPHCRWWHLTAINDHETIRCRRIRDRWKAARRSRFEDDDDRTE